MDPTEKVQIGATGVEVTRLGLGGAALAGMVAADGIYQGSTYDEGLRLIRRAYDLGVRYFDTAPLYGEGRSEMRYARVLKDMPRDQFVMSTKVSRLFVPTGPATEGPENPDGVPPYEMRFDFSADGIRRSLEGSLERLGMQQVEIVYLHDSDYDGQHSDAEFAQGLETLRRFQ
ncbi:MAG: hypothetical protein GKR89_31555 [Candidatus Latescibacteria bacterium]|nr:hypothetical protein [Candidatus Latescibacterota bacterium]